MNNLKQTLISILIWITFMIYTIEGLIHDLACYIGKLLRPTKNK